MIVNELGAALHPETLSDKWEVLLRTAGVKRIRRHDARHICATMMHLEGIEIATIAAWLGHADPAFTMRTYVHSQAAGALDPQVLGETGWQPTTVEHLVTFEPMVGIAITPRHV